MPRPIEALIHQAALAHNFAQARRRAKGANVFAVMKANAYGHGIENVYPALPSADGFALLDLQEAKRLRALGWRGPILLLEGCFEPSDLDLCSSLQLWHVVHQQRQIDWLAKHKPAIPHRIFLKLNSGMNRLGFSPSEFRRAWTQLTRLAQVEMVALMTHFSDADGGRGVSHQVAAFEQATEGLPGPRSLSNSAALLRYGHDPALRADWVRSGIMTYGGSPDHPLNGSHHWDLRPAMTLRSRIIAVQHLSFGDSVGYGSSFIAPDKMRVGVVACGYADGYPRHAGHGTPVLVGGMPTTTVGRVSMDMLVVDLSGLPFEGLDSEVTLWGEGPNSTVLPIDRVAAASGTIGYELMCALAPRVPVRAVQPESLAASARPAHAK